MLTLPFMQRYLGKQARIHEAGPSRSPFYYYDIVVDEEAIVNRMRTKAIAANGIMPGKEGIIDGAYPYIAEVYVAVRSDR